MNRESELYKEVFNKRDYHLFDECDLRSPMRFIHWNKRPFLEELLQNVPDDVNAIIVFGSAVNLRHHEGSDLDLVVIGEKGTASLRDACVNIFPDFEVDIIDYPSLQDIIDKKGTNMYWVEDDILDYGVPIFVRDLDFNIKNTDQ